MERPRAPACVFGRTSLPVLVSTTSILLRTIELTHAKYMELPRARTCLSSWLQRFSIVSGFRRPLRGAWPLPPRRSRRPKLRATPTTTGCVDVEGRSVCSCVVQYCALLCSVVCVCVSVHPVHALGKQMRQRKRVWRKRVIVFAIVGCSGRYVKALPGEECNGHLTKRRVRDLCTSRGTPCVERTGASRRRPLSNGMFCFCLSRCWSCK